MRKCGCEDKKVFDCGRSDTEHKLLDLSNDFLIVLELLDRNTKGGYPQDQDTGECYFCDTGRAVDDDLDLLGSPDGHKPTCAWRQARELFDEKKIAALIAEAKP